MSANISEKYMIFPDEQKAWFLKQVVITILNFSANKEYYLKLSKEQFLNEEFPLSKKFTFEELKKQFSGIE